MVQGCKSLGEVLIALFFIPEDLRNRHLDDVQQTNQHCNAQSDHCHIPQSFERDLVKLQHVSLDDSGDRPVHYSASDVVVDKQEDQTHGHGEQSAQVERRLQTEQVAIRNLILGVVDPQNSIGDDHPECKHTQPTQFLFAVPEQPTRIFNVVVGDGKVDQKSQVLQYPKEIRSFVSIEYAVVVDDEQLQ